MTTQIKVLITAKNGQLGWELSRTLPVNVDAVFLDSKELNITDINAVAKQINCIKPDLVINAAAYTAVDKAETERETAYSVNQNGARNLALACKEIDAKLIHISTDFVFDGSKNTPYQPQDETNPPGVYGESKLAGEQAVIEILGEQATIIRTAWVYSPHGTNFVKTMLRLMTEKDQINVVADQMGTPTNAKNLAKAIWLLADKMSNTKTERVYHWTDLGIASWYDFAVAIQEVAYEQGMLSKKIMINPIETSQYPTAAKRPAYSVLNTNLLRNDLAVSGTCWRKSLSDIMHDFKVV